eukprot:CAMPEP_0114012258 /NCGR_PEP_ID=MMETSP0372-20130328/9266_1 /TAXON_ID=340204 /ORGANISM="Lankesteria abbotti" /LENGTH=32 /assembly_acc=CAM_ASM_000359
MSLFGCGDGAIHFGRSGRGGGPELLLSKSVIA